MSEAPAGWYPDPASSLRLRHWTGSEWTDHITAERPRHDVRQGYNMVAAGIIVFVLGLAASVVFFVLSVLTANACGMFADGCDDYGQTAPGFAWFASGTVASIAAAVAGVVVAVVSAARRRRRR